MKAQTPPIAWAWAMMWLISVVLPEDSGPKISTMRPRGTPPMPSARSSDRAPVGIASTFTRAPGSPIFITAPLPNCRSIWVRAPWRAVSFAFAGSWMLMEETLDLRSDSKQGAFATKLQRICAERRTGWRAAETRQWGAGRQGTSVAGDGRWTVAAAARTAEAAELT